MEDELDTFTVRLHIDDRHPSNIAALASKGFWTWKSILFLGLITLCVIGIVLAFLFIIFRKKLRRTKQTPAESEPAQDTSSDQKHPLVSDV